MFVYLVRKLLVGVLCILLINIPLATIFFIQSGLQDFNWMFVYYMLINIIAFIAVGAPVSILADFVSRGYRSISLLVHLSGGALFSIIWTGGNGVLNMSLIGALIYWSVDMGLNYLIKKYDHKQSK
ncbi:hypothetical protein IC620_09065 [Hazenella sp. IB182357]|uniref:Uncharacterized protein n=1 Tax=Polycladospora coralii TaxID=2771432 RepID=A0A926NB86_9BACL|nr:hypothetical protein [Polycladospora coralii]MBD1372505.1 hypothetical protein [Polycladospora coralii]